MKKLISAWLVVLALVSIVGTYGSSLRAADQSEPHAFVVTCVDPRYDDVEHRETLTKTLPRCYHFCAAGCSKCLVEDEDTRKAFYHQLDVLAAKRITEVNIVDHDTCAGYDNDDSFPTHVKNLRAAAELLHRDPRSKHLKVNLWLHEMGNRRLVRVPEKD